MNVAMLRLLYTTLRRWSKNSETRQLKKLEAFEIWCYRHILKISYVQRVTNVHVLHRMVKNCVVIQIMKTLKLKYLEHIMRGEKYSLLRIIMQGKIKSKRNIGRKKVLDTKSTRMFGCSTTELFREQSIKYK